MALMIIIGCLQQNFIYRKMINSIIFDIILPTLKIGLILAKNNFAKKTAVAGCRKFTDHS